MKLEGVFKLKEERTDLVPKMLKYLLKTDNLGQMLKQVKEEQK